jgi:ATP-binding cassette, subfamily G (WHITE), member 2, SNQ2
MPSSLPRLNFAGGFAQMTNCFKRDMTIASRDLTLYYLQYALQIVFGLQVGGLFINLDWSIDPGHLPLGFSGVTWITALNIYVFVFKALYFNDLSIRANHEKFNFAYRALPAYFADLAVNLLLAIGYFVGNVVAYFMIGIQGEDTGFDASAFGFIILLAYVSAFAAEPVPAIVCQFTSPNLPVSMITVQGVLLIMFMFSGGIFIRDGAVPDGWKWVKEISPFQHAGNAFIGGAWDHLDYTCKNESLTELGQSYVQACDTNDAGYCCNMELGSFQCQSFSNTTGDCSVAGLEVVKVYKLPNGVDKWESLGYLAMFGGICRLIVLFLNFFPPSELLARIQNAWAKPSETMLKSERTQATSPGKSTKKDETVGALATTQRTDLIMNNISVILKKKVKDEKSGKQVKKTLVSAMSATAPGGQVTALMGPSGAGKTTLLNAISGMAPYADVEGIVTLGGHSLHKSFLGYVPQFDHLQGVFTVRETLTSVAMLKCKIDATAVEKYIKGNAELLGYSDLLDQPVGALAQGQKKIISVAIGLVANPKALFLDEPTTGLDSTAAHYVVSYLRRVADSGVTVLMTIHQPSAAVFDMCDNMLLLDSTGHLAYDGPISASAAYFERAGFKAAMRENPADVALTAVSGAPAGAASWSSFWTGSAEAGAARMVRSASKTVDAAHVAQTLGTPSEMERFKLLVKKLMVYYWRSKPIYLYRLVSICIFGLFAGSLYVNTPTTVDSLTEVVGIIFFGLWCSLYLTLGNIPNFVEDRMECENGYASGRHGLFTYYAAQFVASQPYQFICATALTVLIHFMPKINETADAFFYALLVSYLMMNTMEAISWMSIEKLRNAMLCVTASMVFMSMLFMFAGFFIHVPDMPKAMAWMAYTTPSLYVFKGHLYNYFHDVEFALGDVSIPTAVYGWEESAGSGSGSEWVQVGTELVTYSNLTRNGDLLLDSMFDVKFKDDYYMKWLMLVIGVGFVFMFRFNHYVFVYQSTSQLGASLEGKKKKKKKGNKAPKIEQVQDAAKNDTVYLEAKSIKPVPAEDEVRVTFV